MPPSAPNTAASSRPPLVGTMPETMESEDLDIPAAWLRHFTLHSRRSAKTFLREVRITPPPLPRTNASFSSRGSHSVWSRRHSTPTNKKSANARRKSARLYIYIQRVCTRVHTHIWICTVNIIRTNGPSFARPFKNRNESVPSTYLFFEFNFLQFSSPSPPLCFNDLFTPVLFYFEFFFYPRQNFQIDFRYLKFLISQFNFSKFEISKINFSKFQILKINFSKL